MPSVAAEFNKSVKLSGVVLTKVDGIAEEEPCCQFGQLQDAQSDSSATQKLDGLELFDAKRFADRILGMGDILSL